MWGRDVIEEGAVVGQGLNRFDFYLGLLLVTVVILGGGVVVVALWPWHVIMAFVLAAIGVGVLGLRLFMAWEHHRVDILAKRNRAAVLHESEQGFGYIEQGKVGGYSHAVATYPPMLPEARSNDFMVPEPPQFPKSFGEMVRAGYVAPGQDFVLGFGEEDGEAVRMPSLTSMGIGGGQGSGKTVSTLSLMSQSVAKYNGHLRFLVADPHMHVSGEESLLPKIEALRPFFLTIDGIRATVPADDHDYHALLNQLSDLPNPTVGGTELAQWMKIVEMEMQRRVMGKTGEVWVLVMDEFVEIMSNDKTAKPVASMLEKINQQARKMDMFALLVSQEWKATRTGGSELRHSIVSFIVHNMPEAIATLIVPSDLASQAPRMRVGQAILYTRGVGKVGRVPYATPEDAANLVALYHPHPHYQIREVESVHEAEFLELPAGKQPTGPLPDEFTQAEVSEVQELFIRGLNDTDIAKRVYKVKSGPELSEAKIRVRKQLEWLVQNGWS